MQKSLLFVALLSTVACGDGTPEPHEARALWGTLTASDVARPFSLDDLAQSEASVSPVCAGGGDAQGEMWLTAYASRGEGEASGSARYTLEGCRAAQQKLAVHGELQRGFKVRRQQQRAPNAFAAEMAVTRYDTFYGTLHLRDPDATCRVDVTRIYENDAYTYTGTLCGHKASTLGLTER